MPAPVAERAGKPGRPFGQRVFALFRSGFPIHGGGFYRRMPKPVARTKR